MDNGADLDYYSEEELQCFDDFIKAEAATQNLDLRPNSEKIIDGQYVPQKIEDLGENEFPGTILIQRTNTNGNTSAILEYKEKTEFDKLVTENNGDVINYFTVDEEGNVIIAKWDHILVTVEGEYPENLSEAEKDIHKDEDIITTEKIPYSQYIEKYTMPFEFLVQLLVITEEPDFCMELVNYVLNSKIVINIQEEEKVTVTDETRNYTVHSKNEKYINYQVDAPNATTIVKEDNYFLKYAKDDEQNDCTNYSNENLTVKIHTEYTSHSYVFEIIEADTWIAHYKKTYDNQTGITHPTTTNNLEPVSNGYKEIGAETNQPIIDENTISNDKDVKTFINETKANYEPKIIVPQEITISDVVTDKDGNKFKVLNVIYKDGTTKEYKKCPEIKDEDGNATGQYSLPTEVVITTDKVASTDLTKEIPQINYTFKLESSTDNSGQNIDSYKLQTDIDPLINCTVSGLKIDKFEKIDLLDTSTIATTVTEYPADPTPFTETHIYAKDDNGNFEKFLVAYDNSSGARNQLNSIDSWLYEMMEENTATVELVDTVKYLLYMYDGVNRGVTELEGFEELFNPGEFSSVTSEIYGNTVEEKVWWALIDAGYRKEAAAGVMGNLWKESGIRTNNLQNSFEDSLGYTDESYTESINDGTYTLEQFKNDKAGYGLAQWTYNSRKEKLYKYAKDKDVSIDNVNMQIEYLLAELSYSSDIADYQLISRKGFCADDWINATTPEEAAEAFCWIFENPGDGDKSDRSIKAREYYEKYKDATKPSFSCVTVKAAGYEFPQYYQRDYTGSYGTSTIKAAGCGPTSLAMILAGIKGDPSITPETVVNNIKEYWSDGSYYVSGVGSSHCIFRSDFLEKYYGVTSESTSSEAEAMEALEKGYSVIGGEDGHILAIIPAPDEYKAQGYKFYILDSGKGHGGPYKSASQASAVVDGNLRFIAIIKP